MPVSRIATLIVLPFVVPQAPGARTVSIPQGRISACVAEGTAPFTGTTAGEPCAVCVKVIFPNCVPAPVGLNLTKKFIRADGFRLPETGVTRLEEHTSEL